VRSQKDRLVDIVSAVNDAAVLVQRGHSKFVADPLLIRAAKNIISEIGEAAKGLDDELLATMPGVPWKNVKGMRHKVVHAYPEVVGQRLAVLVEGGCNAVTPRRNDRHGQTRPDRSPPRRRA